MAKAHHRRGPANGAQTAPLDRADLGGRGCHRRLSPTHPLAAGRLPLCPAAHDPAPHAIIAAPLSATPRHRSPARHRRRQAQALLLQGLPDRFLPHRYRRGAHRGGRLYLFVAIDRTSKFAFAQLHEKATRRIAADFLRALIKAVPYRIHTVLTDNGTHFTTPGNTSSATPDIKATIEAGEIFLAHAFEYACAQNDIEHRLTKPRHPWTNGQVERMNRTLKDATVRRYHYGSHDQLRAHLQLFLDAYNYARRLKTLRGLTPYEFICKTWTDQPNRFRFNPIHLTPGPNI